jgi:hypothetical protein
MDPISTAIISAVSAGATSGVTDVAKKAIVEGHEGLKALLKKKFGHNSKTADAIEKFQDTPDSLRRQEELAQELKTVNASADPELVSAAQSLLGLINSLPQGGKYSQIAEGSVIAQAADGSTASVTYSDGARTDRDHDPGY